MEEDSPPPMLEVLERIVEANAMPSLLVAASERIVFANQAALDVTGATDSAQLVGASLDVFNFDPTITDQNRRLFRDVASGVVLSLTAAVTFRRMDGTTATAMVSQSGVTVAEGRFVLVAVLEPANDSSEPRPRTASGFAILVTDHDWRIRHATASARELVGTEGQVAAALFGLVHPLDIPPLAAALSLLSYSGSSLTLRLRVRSRDAWLPVAATVGALCEHRPPRLVWLLSNARTGPGDDTLSNDDRIDATILRLARARLDPGVEFSDRELEIIGRSLRGEQPAEIARQMFLSRGTIRNALTRIYRKMGVHSQTGLVGAVVAGATSGHRESRRSDPPPPGPVA